MTYPTEDALAALAANGHGIDKDAERGEVQWTMVQRLNEAGWIVTVWPSGHVKACRDMDEVKMHPDLLAAYKAHCTPATPGEVAVEPEQPKPLRKKGGVAAILGRWPGDETDEQVERAMREMDEPKGGAMPTNEEQYEAMVARGYKGPLRYYRARDGDEYWSIGEWDIPEDAEDAVVSDCLLAGQLEAINAKGYNEIPTRPEQVWKLYLSLHPLSSPPEPSAAEELAGPLAVVKALRQLAESVTKAADDVHAATAGGR